ncbi:MAG: molecular chaperone DjiA [Bacteroidetes bacterium]|nr:molecular chaperone DjiA [Bacteroidota bacterium]
MSYKKWIGGAIGWALGGPIGGLIGFAVGYMADDSSLSTQTDSQPRTGRYRRTTSPGDFSSALLVLSAAVMKADGKLMKSELQFIREFYAKQFGEAAAAEQIGILKELLNKDIPVREVCHQIRDFMEHPMRLQLMHYLFGIAQSDGKVDLSEITILNQIATDMNISSKDFESLKAMFYKDINASYTILEIDPEATDDEVKKAFRKMAMKYHPDKVKDLGEQHAKAAQEKFIKVQEAYDHIRKERGMK